MKCTSVSVCSCLLLTTALLIGEARIRVLGNIEAHITNKYWSPLNDGDWDVVDSAITPHAEANKSVTAARVNGVYRDSHNEFRVLSLGHHKLKVQFKGEWMSITGSPHTGVAMGEASIEGNVATFIPGDTTKCKIAMSFFANKLVVKQEGTDADCGFGANVNAMGTYRRIKAGRPRFTQI